MFEHWKVVEQWCVAECAMAQGTWSVQWLQALSAYARAGSCLVPVIWSSMVAVCNLGFSSFLVGLLEKTTPYCFTKYSLEWRMTECCC